ncbi:MAG: hypothetical protein NZ700_13870 [Gemmataceae bacterium]|nr:hypothetical protein [Gemmataceae bacterium]MDW8267229.1 hypothetical protein [Gemmataceae bacterium]
MSGTGDHKAGWGYAVEGRPSPLLQAALRAHQRRNGAGAALPAAEGDAAAWVRRIAEALRDGLCRAAVVFCHDPGLACCIANKVPGVRCLAVDTLEQARRAIGRWRANLLVVDPNRRTYFECRELLRLCQESVTADCPASVAGVLRELDGHAHR